MTSPAWAGEGACCREARCARLLVDLPSTPLRPSITFSAWLVNGRPTVDWCPPLPGQWRERIVKRPLRVPFGRLTVYCATVLHPPHRLADERKTYGRLMTSPAWAGEGACCREARCARLLVDLPSTSLRPPTPASRGGGNGRPTVDSCPPVLRHDLMIQLVVQRRPGGERLCPTRVARREADQNPPSWLSRGASPCSRPAVAARGCGAGARAHRA